MLLRRLFITLGLLATAALAAACGDSAGNGSRDLADVRLVVWQPDGSFAEQDSIDALQAEAPFEIVVPPEDPAGAELVDFRLMPAYRDQAADRLTSVDMVWVSSRSAERPAAILLQSITGISHGGDEEQVELEQGPAILTRAEGESAIEWEQCGVGLLFSFWPEVLDEDEAIEFANSMADAC